MTIDPSPPLTVTPEPVRGRRARILEAAIEAFAARGYNGASTREIAGAAGVTDPLLFYHFKTKADLYLAAVRDQLEKLGIGLDDALAGVEDPWEQLRLFVEVYLRYFLDLEPGLTVTLRELTGVPEPAATEITVIHWEAVVEKLQAILVTGDTSGAFRLLDVKACAMAITGILQVFIRVEARTPGAFSREQAIAQVMEYYAASLRPLSR